MTDGTSDALRKLAEQREIKHDTLMHIEAGAFGADVLGCPRCDLQRARFHDAMEDQVLNQAHAHLPACAHCAENKHDECEPLLTQGNKSTICSCFSAHPESDEHTEALFWLGEYGTKAQEDHITYGGDAS